MVVTIELLGAIFGVTIPAIVGVVWLTSRLAQLRILCESNAKDIESMAINVERLTERIELFINALALRASEGKKQWNAY